MNPDFETWFCTATGYAPRPWQAALAAQPAPGHRRIRIPTGFGKTLGVAGAWLYHRVVLGDLSWPTRLVWALPMRTLVEQTVAECQGLLSALDLLRDPHGPEDQPGKVGVTALMGGVDAGAWHLLPTQPGILVGTQDMLLSRALNRGYGAARGRWPIDFGLLSQDSLWVLDELQLMGVGFATALQLAAFRDLRPTLRPSFTWAMSATLQPAWFDVSPDTQAINRKMVPVGLDARDEQQPLWTSSTKPLATLSFEDGAASAPRLAARIVAEHAGLPGDTATTLVVCNTVDRACTLYDALVRALGGAADLHLLHSRFRRAERRGWSAWLRDDAPRTRSRILVATQVVEAGVDLSADLLFTELCPWPSLVQRLGRLARRGGSGRAFVLGLDDKRAAPYELDELAAAWDALQLLSDGAPRALADFEREHEELLPGLFPFEPSHLLLQEELDELFDTTADLSGGDLDISRYIRDGDERDLTVAWIQLAPAEGGAVPAPAAELRPSQDALCAVPFLQARDWLCGSGKKGAEPRRLRKGVSAWVWDYLDGRWRSAERGDLRPGAQVLVDARVGGYSPGRGFDANSREAVPVVAPILADPQERADAAQDQDDLSQASWQTIGFHGGAVARQVTALLDPLSGLRDRFGTLLHLAARWHDLGKAHPAFQGAIHGGPARGDLAKAPAQAWDQGRCIYVIPGDPPQPRPGLRHELASTLALFDVLSRHAAPEHASRLGPWASVVDGAPARQSSGPTSLEQEVLALAPQDFDLVAFLVCAHHGKVRARLHAVPVDQRASPRDGSLPIRGIYDGDPLPAVDLEDAAGTRFRLPESRLSLEPAALGISSLTGRSWTQRVDALRDHHGPFVLAWLEALLRAADVRASRDATLSDPALSSNAASTESR